MILTGDYHTHTTYSHGKGSILDNALSAKEKGITQIGISDHGFSHPAFGLRKRYLSKMRKECDDATNKTGVKVLLGIESNIIGTDGTVDLKEDRYNYFDIFLAGIHKFVLYKFGTMFSLFAPNFITSTLKFKPSKSLIKENTKTLINVVKNNPVDIITHLNFCSYTNSLEVAKACEDYGTYLEISSKKAHLSTEELVNIVAKTNVKFVINSDAHSVDRIGDTLLAEKAIKEANIPLDRIDNIDGKLPNFRFKKFKERLG